MGIGGEIWKWVYSFHCYRQQRLDVDGAKSEWARFLQVSDSVTVLGHLQFSLYINGILTEKGYLLMTACSNEIKDTEDTLILITWDVGQESGASDFNQSNST